MGALVGQLLPLAVGIAVSPIPIIALTLMLTADRARQASVGFAIGWVIGVVGVTVVFQLLSAAADPAPGTGASTVFSWLKLLLGLGLLALAVSQWRQRPGPGRPGTLPAWMSAVQRFSAGRAVGLGLFLTAVGAKNLILCAAAAGAIATAGASVGQVIVAYVVFTVIAASTVLVPVIGSLVAAQWFRPRLESLRDWLEQNNATVMAVLLLVLGVNQVGKGLGGLF